MASQEISSLMQRHFPFGLKKKDGVISILILRHQGKSCFPITKNIFNHLSYVITLFHASRAMKTTNLLSVCLSRERSEMSYILALLRRPLEPLSDSLNYYVEFGSEVLSNKPYLSQALYGGCLSHESFKSIHEISFGVCHLKV